MAAAVERPGGNLGQGFRKSSSGRRLTGTDSQHGGSERHTAAHLKQTRLRWHRVRNDRPRFVRAPPCRWNPRTNLDGLVNILGFDEIVAAELFLGLGEWPVGHQFFSVTKADSLCFLCQVQLVS